MPNRKSYVSINSMLYIHAEQQGYITYCRTPQELGRLALGLLVDELGTEGARLFLRDHFKTFLRDFKGIGRDDRPRYLDRPDPRVPVKTNPTSHMAYHTADN